ncbi:MAG: hypothetical protein ACI89Z_000114 [Porticoccus sp.]|jgi:hypothetical protein
MKSELTRLPCRGCLRSCINYTTCKGRPWRLPITEGTSEEINKEQDKTSGNEK